MMKVDLATNRMILIEHLAKVEHSKSVAKSSRRRREADGRAGQQVPGEWKGRRLHCEIKYEAI
jgi:hypothetical protein